MPEGWQWDPTLFAGSASYYVRGRLPYPPSLPGVLADSLGLDGSGRLLDVGCGPGDIALLFASRFAAVIGLDPDADMLEQARLRARGAGIGNARWVHARAEEMPRLDLGTFRVATFAASFHWMDRDQVASTIHDMLEPDGAFVLISAVREELPIPDEVGIALLERYLGPRRRAGQGTLGSPSVFGGPDDENAALARAGFSPPETVMIPAGETLVRSIDDLVATAFSKSNIAPHLFGDRLAAFEADFRALLLEHQPPDGYRMQIPETELRIWRR